ncbi:MAG: hypothetical protein H7174_08400 [Flavobacterium sp.]|nr:hypothetical protein [Flavobacterium sp.]
MKKTIFFTLCLSALITFSASAKIWRVNNNPGITADFTTLQAAHDAAMINDTLHIEPSIILYDSLIATKRLVILGNGYFLNENLNNQANLYTSHVQYIYPYPGSEGTVIEGLQIDGIYIQDTSNITINRNLLGGVQFSQINTGPMLNTNLTITKNIITYGINCELANVTNIFIANNYISAGDISLSQMSSGAIANNVITGYLRTSNCIIQNNIISGYAGEMIGTIYVNNTMTHNFSAQLDGLPAGNGNQNGVSWESIFVDPALNTTDGKWQLKPGSPAIGAGIGGVDCGMFGGSNPYKLSGLPTIPSIYSLSAPANSNGNTLLVNISVKSNN